MKLEIDFCCFAAGVLVATARPLWRLAGRIRDLGPAACWSSRQEPLLHGARSRFSLMTSLHKWYQMQMDDKSTAFKNYFWYLATCCCTMLLLFAVSQALAYCFLGPRTLRARSEADNDPMADSLLWPGSLFANLCSVGEDAFGWTFATVFVNGFVFLAATVLLERWCEQPTVSEDLRRAIWVHGLPVKDQRLNPFVRERFRLTVDELQRVGTDLATAINDELLKNRGIQCADDGEWVVDEWDSRYPRGMRCNPSRDWSVGKDVGAKGIYIPENPREAVFVRKVPAASRVDRVWVTPAVESWRSVSDKLEETMRQQQGYREMTLRYYGVSHWDTAWRAWYQLWSEAYANRVRSLEAKLLKIRLRKMHMCGSAFVLFRKPEDCEKFLGNAPKWWDCGRWMCWFNNLKFGHVPFTSVTLEYEPAPHPDDINWENMDTPRWLSELLFALLTLALIVAMLVIVTPINIPKYLRFLPYGDKVTAHFASLLLLFINRTLLPFPIEWIALAGRFRRKTEGELRQLHLNFWLLIMNTGLVPLLGVRILQQLPSTMSNGLPAFVRQVSTSLLTYPKRLFIGYLLDVTFLTNLYQVLAGSIFGLCGRLQERLMATRALERGKAAPPLYAFGYYYAWTLSIVALALVMSAEVPSMLLLATLCFAIRVVVDWCNLQARVYEIGPEHEGVFITAVVLYLRLILSGWWLFTGLGFQMLCPDGSAECPLWIQPLACTLVVLAALVLVLSACRASYVIALRRFLPGRLSRRQAPITKGDGPCTPEVLQAPWVEPAPGPVPRMMSWYVEPAWGSEHSARCCASASSCLEGPGTKLQWDATPAFRSTHVEDIIEYVRWSPSLESDVLKGLQQGKSVQEIMQRLPESRKAHSCAF